ncbi:MAG: nucleotidyltransferase family protein [Candidatus Omnitrophica bacterium]|nr:nucleotidyltransferase family protein [Candidatus Omnitrophota bacterium]
MRADFLILCGGLGTRLRAVTGDTPKVMADVQGEPFLDFLLRYLIKQGARRVILCAGYKAEALEEHYQQKFKEIEIHLSIEKEPLGTGGAFKNAQRLIKNDHVFGLNGDCFTPVDYQKLFAFHQEKKALGTLVAVKIDGNKDFGTIVTNEKDEVIAFKEKFQTTEIQYISAGIYCFHRSVFDRMPSEKFSIEYHFFPKMIGDRFYGFKVEAPFIDIGTPERFEWAKKHLAEMLG